MAASAPVASGATTILQGDVYNEASASVDGATVTVNSLDAHNPYSATLNAVQGHYVTNNVPVGVQLQITVSKPNWTTRTRVTSLQSNANQRNTLNFGGPNNVAEDNGGAPYFISNYPEVASTVPAPETTKGDKVSYKLRVSEPLDEANRRRLENAVVISSGAAPGTTDPIVINRNSTFLMAREKVSMSWNADNTELTITFNAPLRALRTDKKTYSLALTRQTGDDPIVDGENNVLGFVTPQPSSQYSKAIKLASLKFGGSEANATDRWNSTHTAGSGFDVSMDDTKPTVTAVSGSGVTIGAGDYERFEITFSKPMLVYPDNTTNVSPFGKTLQGSDSSVATMNNNYAFAISDVPIKGQDMDKVLTNPRQLSTTTQASDVLTWMQQSVPFTVTDTARAHVQVSPSDPHVVQFDILRSLIPTNARYVRVRVDPAVTDPAGNRVSESNKNSTDFTADNVKDGTM